MRFAVDLLVKLLKLLLLKIEKRRDGATNDRIWI